MKRMRAMWTDDRWEPITWPEHFALVAMGAALVWGSVIVLLVAL